MRCVWEWTNRWSPAILAVTTTVYAAVSIGQLETLKSQQADARAMYLAAAAPDAQVDTAMVPLAFALTAATEGNVREPAAAVWVNNMGKSPIRDVHLRATLEAGELELSVDATEKVAPADGGQAFFAFDLTQVKDVKLLIAAGGGAVPIYVRGQVEYLDVFGTAHGFAFCRLHLGGTDHWGQTRHCDEDAPPQ